MKTVNVPLSNKVAAGYHRAGIDPVGLAANFLRGYDTHAKPANDELIDLIAADGGKYHNLNQWLALYATQNGEFKGKRMIDTADVYRVTKSGSDEQVANLRSAIESGWLIATPAIDFEPTTLDARITHYAESKVNKHVVKNVAVPEYKGISLASAIHNDKVGVEKYLQAYFNTRDLVEKIGETLSHLSGKTIDNIYIYTPDRNSRMRNLKRAAYFISNGERFHVGGNNWPDDVLDGRSRGVSVKSGSAKPTRKK